MSVLDATTGHSRPEERKVAKLLYVAIIVAVLAAIAVFFVLGQQRNLNPTNLDQPAPTESTPSTTPTGPTGP